MKRLLSKITVKGSSSPITIPGVSVMLLLAFSPFITAPAQSVEEHVYYGVIPSRLYLYRPYRTTHGSADISRGWYLDEGTVKTSGFIAIIGSEEKTHKTKPLDEDIKKRLREIREKAQKNNK